MKFEIRQFKKNHFVVEYPQLTFYGETKQTFKRFSSKKEIKEFVEDLKIKKTHFDNKKASKFFDSDYLPFLNTININNENK